MEINTHYERNIHLPVWLQKEYCTCCFYCGYMLVGEGVLMRHMRDSYTIFIEKLEWKRSFWKVIFKLMINGVQVYEVC